MNNQNKYDCYLIDNFTIKTMTAPSGDYNDWTAPLFVDILARDSHSSRDAALGTLFQTE